MTWYGILLVVTWVAQVAATVATVGRPREPVTSQTAAFNVAVTALLIWGLVAVGT